MIYTKDQLAILKIKTSKPLFNKIKRINFFIDNNWDKYVEGCCLVKQGETNWAYSTSLNDIIFFCKTQEYFLNLIKN